MEIGIRIDKRVQMGIGIESRTWMYIRMRIGLNLKMANETGIYTETGMRFFI